MDSLEAIDKSLEKYNFPKLSQKEIENLNRHITNMEIKIIIIIKKKSSNKQKCRTRWLHR